MDFSNVLGLPPLLPLPLHHPRLSSSPLMTLVSYCPLLQSTFSHLPKQSLPTFLDSVGFFSGHILQSKVWN